MTEPETEAGRALLGYLSGPYMGLSREQSTIHRKVLAIEAELRRSLAAKARALHDGLCNCPADMSDPDCNAPAATEVLRLIEGTDPASPSIMPADIEKFTDEQFSAFIKASGFEGDIDAALAEVRVPGATWKTAATPVEGTDPASPEPPEPEFRGVDTTNPTWTPVFEATPVAGSTIPESKVLRLTGEQLASIEPPISDDWDIDWDEYEEFVVAGSTIPPLDVERLARALKWITEGTPGWLAGVDQINSKNDVEGLARAIAAEYARLAGSTVTEEPR